MNIDDAKVLARKAARELLSLADDDSPNFWQGIIAKARQAEREELRRLREELDEAHDVQQTLAESYKEAHDQAKDEKARRVYYQDIVYAVCNRLDKLYGTTVQCGTVDEPSTEVQDLMARLISTPDTILQAKLTAAEARVRELEYVMGFVMRRAASIANDAETVLNATADAKGGSDAG